MTIRCARLAPCCLSRTALRSGVALREERPARSAGSTWIGVIAYRSSCERSVLTQLVHTQCIWYAVWALL
jgi:hypothetical protein